MGWSSSTGGPWANFNAQVEKQIENVKEIKRVINKTRSWRSCKEVECNLPGEKGQHGVDTYCLVPESPPFLGPSASSVRSAHLPHSAALTSIQMATIGTAVAIHCDPTPWLEFIGPRVGLGSSWLIRMHPWEFGIRMKLFQLHLAAWWNRDLNWGTIGNLFQWMEM